MTFPSLVAVAVDAARYDADADVSLLMLMPLLPIAVYARDR